MTIHGQSGQRSQSGQQSHAAFFGRPVRASSKRMRKLILSPSVPSLFLDSPRLRRVEAIITLKRLRERSAAQWHIQ